MRARALFLSWALFAVTLRLQANDKPLFIELEPRSQLFGSGISATGAMVVGTELNGGGFYWMPTTGVIYIGGTVTGGVSRDGRTIVGRQLDLPTRTIQAAIWLRGTEWRLLGSFPNSVPCQNEWSVASKTSGDGRVVVGVARNGCTYAHAFRWEESTGMVDLGSLVDGHATYATGVSADGRVVIGYQESEEGYRFGTRWVDRRQELIPSDSRLWNTGTARGANRDGSIVVGQECHFGDPLQQAAWVWTSQSGTRCLDAPRRMSSGIERVTVAVTASGASDDGKVVAGGQGVIGTTDSEAVIWIDGIGNYLKDYLLSKGVTNVFDRWVNTGEITDVAPDGRTLVGYGASPTGYRAYMVILGDKP